MDLQETILQLLVVGAPAIVLYFTGWSYLYFYLDTFKINISEFGFDPATVFIYAYPPLHTLWEFYETAVIIIIVIVAALAFLATAAWRSRGRMPWVQRIPGFRLARFVLRQIRALPPTAWSLGFLLFLIFVLPFPIKSLTEWAALHAANRVWEGQAVELVPDLKKEPPAALIGGRARPIDPRSTQSDEKNSVADDSRLAANYRECLKRDELGLIFSSEAHYYLLCRAEADSSTGTIFEVTGKEGLVSVRYVYR